MICGLDGYYFCCCHTSSGERKGTKSDAFVCGSKQYFGNDYRKVGFVGMNMEQESGSLDTHLVYYFDGES